MKTIYKGDSRYEKVFEQMQLLGIQDVSTTRQVKNGTIVWRLPILSDKPDTYIEYAAFASGYVRNQGVDCHSNWQINRRVDGEPQYYERFEGLFERHIPRTFELIPIEIDRLEYMMKYVIKNEFIKRANYVQEGKFVPKWKHENLLCAMEAQTEGHNVKDVTVIIDGHKYKVI
jgi:hypothetical protein